MSKSMSRYPSLSVEGGGTGIVSHAGTALLLRAGEKTGLLDELSRALAPWRKPLAIHDPGKIVFDLAVSVAIGGDCLADIAHLRGDRDVFGPVASDPTVSRLITTLAAEVGPVLAAINTARATARAHAWDAAGAAAPDVHCAQGGLVVVDLDASLLTAHSEKECAAPTYKRGFGFHPLCAFVDHGPEGTGEPVAMMLRPGNAGANTAADHITVTDQVLTQIRTRPDSVLIRTDSAGGTHEFLNYLTDRGLGYSVGFGLTQTAAQAIDRLLPQVWTPAYDADGTEREGAWVAELTGMLDLSSWPAGMRVIVRKERPVRREALLIRMEVRDLRR